MAHETERGVYCPEDGKFCPLQAEDVSTAQYGPCPHCGIEWEYNNENGTYSLFADALETEEYR